ncbi:hypothetical protein GVX82_01220 [Patescibacteria group bacterium]|nr:hypothetical protein [Patescibacteria group bacterium]
MSSSQLHSAVMRRVRRIHLLKRLLAPRALRAYALLLCAVAAAPFVSPASVLQNLARTGDLRAVPDYASGAFLGTEFVVQCALLAALILLGWMARDLGATLAASAGRLRRPA